MIKSRILSSDNKIMSIARRTETRLEIHKKKMAQGQMALNIKNDVIKCINEDQFELATQTLKLFSERNFPYRNYKLKIERYVSHSIDLILALNANKNFSGFNSLTRSKQQELKDKYKKNYNELHETLSKIEMSFYELKFKDNQSTGYFVKAFWVALMIVACSALAIEIFNSIGANAYVLFLNCIDYITEFLIPFV